MRGRKPDANAIRRTGGAAIVERSETAIEKPASVAAVPNLSDTWDMVVGSGMAYDSRDTPLLEQLVFNMETVRQCREACMDERGNIKVLIGCGDPDPVTGEYMDSKPNPYLKAMREAMAEVMKLSDQLGCSPMARARLGLTQASGKAVTLSIADAIDRALRDAK